MHIYDTEINPNTNLKYIFNNYIKECRYSKQLRPQTLKSYEEVFSTFQKIMPEMEEVNDLHPYMMHEFYERLSIRERKVGKDRIAIGVKVSTIKTYYNKLIPFFRWLESKKYIEEGKLSKEIANPPTPKYDDSKALDSVEISQIVASISLSATADQFKFQRDMVIVSLLLYTGIRRGELLGLRIQDVDFISKTIHINGETSKSKKSRSIPMHYTLFTHLKNYLKLLEKRKLRTSALIVSTQGDNPLSVHGLKHWVAKYSKLSSVKFHLHQFRHTFACSLAKKNTSITSIMRVLGHGSLQMTERYLRSIQSESARDGIEKLAY